MRIVLMGVSGCGKTAVGTELAKQLNIPFFDGDNYHSDANKGKMAAGIPLSDDDREPWLKILAKLLEENPRVILACSALKSSYRDSLKVSPDVLFIYLKGDHALICKRMEGRKGHFFDPALLASQYALLEEPKDALVVDVSPPVHEIVTEIRKLLKKYSF